MARKTATSPRAGRPTREQARARTEALLDCAARHFLELGFEKTTIEAIAADVNMTKRTIYARFPDKESLFRAALDRAVQAHAATPEQIAATRAATLEQSLINFAMLRIALIATDRGTRLQRIINTESYRFPDILLSAYEAGTVPAIRFLVNLLNEQIAAGRLTLEDTALAANTFLSMVVSGPVTLLVSGNPLSEAELKRRVAFAVRLFLEGAKRR